MAPNLISRNQNVTSQLSWLSDPSGNLLVRKVVRLENVSSFAFHATCDGLREITNSSLMKDSGKTEQDANVTAVKSTGHAPSAFYYTPEACEVVARRFDDDFAAFGYDKHACL